LQQYQEASIEDEFDDDDDGLDDEFGDDPNE